MDRCNVCALAEKQNARASVFLFCTAVRFRRKAEFRKKKSAINSAKRENEKSAAQALDLEQTPGFIMAAERNPQAKPERSGIG
jgi:hypothetical protein